MEGTLDIQQAKSKIAAAFPSGVKILDRTKPRMIFTTADKEVLYKYCQFLRDQLGFDQCTCVSGVDRCDRFQSVYHLASYTTNLLVEIVVDLPHDNPEVDSVTPLWGGANWHEREAYDMYGIIYKGHPRLERILLPEDYKFFPFRKDCTAGRR